MVRHPSSERFHKLLIEMGELHDRKQADYGRPATDGDAGDPFANVRAAENFGLPGWVGASIRIGDKQRRLEAAARGQNLQNESVEDTFMDMAVYCIIGLLLFQEENEKKTSQSKHRDSFHHESISELTERMNIALQRERKRFKSMYLPKADSGC